MNNDFFFPSNIVFMKLFIFLYLSFYVDKKLKPAFPLWIEIIDWHT